MNYIPLYKLVSQTGKECIMNLRGNISDRSERIVW